MKAHSAYMGVVRHAYNDIMIRRIITIGLLTSVLQILVYILVLDLGWTLGKLISAPQKMTFGQVLEFAISYIGSIYLFGLMLLVTNFLSSVINKRLWTLGLLALLSILYLIAWGEDLDNWPLKTTLFLTAGLVAIYSKLVIDRWFWKHEY